MPNLCINHINTVFFPLSIVLFSILAHSSVQNNENSSQEHLTPILVPQVATEISSAPMNLTEAVAIEAQKFFQANHAEIQEKNKEFLDLQIEEKKVLIEKQRVLTEKERLLVEKEKVQIEREKVLLEIERLKYHELYDKRIKNKE